MVTTTTPVARALAALSVGAAVLAVVLGATTAPDGLGLVFGIAGLLAVGAWGYGLWFGRPFALAGATAVAAGVVALATWSGDVAAWTAAGPAVLLWAGWGLGHLSLVLRAEAVAPAVLHRTLASLAALGLGASALATLVAGRSASAPERGVTAEALAVMSVVALVVGAAALVSAQARTRP